MKRSNGVGLVAMGALAFTASFAGGSALLSWQKPEPQQTCTTGADGRQTCSTPRGSSRYWPSFHYWGYSQGATAATPAAPTNSGARLVAGSPGAGPSGIDTTTRRGFGASARTAFRGSAGG